MSVYSVKGKGWRFDFTLQGVRHTEAWFKTKKAAQAAEAKRKEEIKQDQKVTAEQVIPTDMVFLELINLRLDYLKLHKSEGHYKDTRYKAQFWVKRFGKYPCSQITTGKIELWIQFRSKVSRDAANKEIIYLKSLFNWGIKKKYITSNPVNDIEFLATDKKRKYVPPQRDVEKVRAEAEDDTLDYIDAIIETMARVNEINRLTWDDVDLENRFVVLYTRKKKGGHLTPRDVPMTNRLYEILSRRYAVRDKSLPWVFYHEHRREPFKNRNKLMKRLCNRAGVKPFTYHALRHAGASIMDRNNVPMGSIQRVLGHEKRSTTEIYLHSIGNAEREAIDTFEKVRRQSLTQSLTQKEKGLSLN